MAAIRCGAGAGDALSGGTIAPLCNSARRCGTSHQLPILNAGPSGSAKRSRREMGRSLPQIRATDSRQEERARASRESRAASNTVTACSVDRAGNYRRNSSSVLPPEIVQGRLDRGARADSKGGELTLRQRPRRARRFEPGIPRGPYLLRSAASRSAGVMRPIARCRRCVLDAMPKAVT